MVRRFLFLFTMSITLVGQTQSPLALDTSKPLSGRELQNLLSGNTLIGLDEDGPYWLYYPSRSTLWGRSAGGDVDVGHWWIENDCYCRAWRRWFSGETRCWLLSSGAQGSLLWHSLDGDLEGRSVLKKGNAVGDVLQDGPVASQLADAGTGLSSALGAVIARAAVSDSGVGATDPNSPARDASRTADRTSAGAAPAEGRATKFPLAFVENTDEGGTVSASAAGNSAPGLAGTRLGGFLDRLGIDPASVGGTGNRGGSRDSGAGGGGSTGGGSDRDHN
jgi:hypothetical protein